MKARRRGEAPRLRGTSAPRARPPERSGARGPRERRRWGVRRGEAPRLKMTTASVTTRELAFSQAINEAIRLEMRRDERVIILGEDVAGAAGRAHLGLVDAWGGALRATRGLVQEFGPERVIDTPIAEMGFVGAAVGAAMTGLRPIVEIMFVDLIGVCYDQIVNQAAKMHYMMGGRVSLPMVIRTAFGSRGDKRTYGGGAAAQHSQTLYATLAHVPGLKVVVPEHGVQREGPPHLGDQRRRASRGDGA